MLRWIRAKFSKHNSQPQPAIEVASDNPIPPPQSYSTDQPIQSASDDRFGRAPFAKRLADTIATRRDPSSLVMGLYGPWGDGKTSVLFMLEEQLRTHPSIIPVKFNPWHFGSEDRLLRGFFATLASAVGKEISTRGEKLGEVLKDYGALLSLGSLAFAGGVIQLNPGQAAKDLGESLSTVDLDTLHARIEGLLAESGKHVVVLIDDIDRLDRDETHAIFKLVKLSAGFKYTSYVLAFDADVVAAALGERYGAGGDSAGRAFLEKIVQVPLHLPPADTMALRQLAFEGVDNALKHAEIELKQSDIDAYVRQFIDGIELQMATPRQARLYANALLFALPLVKGEVNTVDLLLVEGIRIFYPKLYVAIRDNPSMFLERPDGRGREQALNQLARLLDTTTTGLTETERTQLKERLLGYLFPRISNVGYGADWEPRWAQEQRICSQAYFKRYFTYGVPPTDVSDTEIDQFIDGLAALDVPLQDEAIRRMASAAASLVIRKLRQREEVVATEKVPAICQTIARNGGLFPRERGPFVMGGTRAQAAILVAHLLRRVPDVGDRERLALSIIESADPLPFAAECIQWMEPSRDEPPERWLLSRETLNRLASTLVERIRASDANEPIYSRFGQDAKTLYWHWKEVDPREVGNGLRDHFTNRPDDVDKFIDVYVGEAWGLESGLPSRADFDRSAYNALSALIDAAELSTNLRDRYGAELDNPTYHHDSDTDLPRRIAHQFMFIHEAVINEAREPAQE